MSSAGIFAGIERGHTGLKGFKRLSVPPEKNLSEATDSALIACRERADSRARINARRARGGSGFLTPRLGAR